MIGAFGVVAAANGPSRRYDDDDCGTDDWPLTATRLNDGGIGFMEA